MSMRIFHDTANPIGTESFEIVFQNCFLLSERIGIRAAIDHYANLHPNFQKTLESEMEDLMDFMFLVDAENLKFTDTELSEKSKNAVRETLDALRKKKSENNHFTAK